MADIDYNLLPVFEALYEERGVGRAAVRLGLTQSAVSQSLGRLRHSLNDQLFLRSARGVVPTARAQELAPLVRETLARWRDACRPDSFDAVGSRREFRIVVGNYVGEMLLPDIIAKIQSESDTIRLRIWNMNSHVGEWLESGMVDVAIGSFEEVPRRVKAQPLFHHRYVWVVRRGHELATSLHSLDQVLAQPRVELDAGEGPVTNRGFWQSGGLRRRAVADVQAMLSGQAVGDHQSVIRFSLHQWRVVLEIVGKSDLFAFLPERIAATHSATYGVTVLDQFEPIPSSSLSMIWDDTQTNEPGNRWLRGLIARSVAGRTDT